MATQQIYPLLTAKDFFEINFGDRKAELDKGAIRMMAGGTARHAEVSGNIFSALRDRLRGSGCRAYGSDMAVRTLDISIRYPDVSVFCRPRDPGDETAKAFPDPRVIVEVLSAGTARTDLRIKLEEYIELPSVDTIVFVDIATERVRIVQRTGPNGWSNVLYGEPADVSLPALNLTIPHAEIFARD